MVKVEARLKALGPSGSRVELDLHRDHAPRRDTARP
jgi:hypothetical protein